MLKKRSFLSETALRINNQIKQSTNSITHGSNAVFALEVEPGAGKSIPSKVIHSTS